MGGDYAREGMGGEDYGVKAMEVILTMLFLKQSTTGIELEIEGQVNIHYNMIS